MGYDDNDDAALGHIQGNRHIRRFDEKRGKLVISALHYVLKVKAGRFERDTTNS